MSMTSSLQMLNKKKLNFQINPQVQSDSDSSSAVENSATEISTDSEFEQDPVAPPLYAEENNKKASRIQVNQLLLNQSRFIFLNFNFTFRSNRVSLKIMFIALVQQLFDTHRMRKKPKTAYIWNLNHWFVLIQR